LALVQRHSHTELILKASSSLPDGTYTLGNILSQISHKYVNNWQDVTYTLGNILSQISHKYVNNWQDVTLLAKGMHQSTRNRRM